MQDSVTILLVEDNAKDLKLSMNALQKANLGNRVDVARDGEEALDYIFCRGQYDGRNSESRPRLVLLDLKLPKVDGLDVLRTMKNDPRTRPIPVVILTSSKEESDLITGYQLGVNAYIQKPMEFERFHAVIKELGLFWLVVNEPPPAAAFRVS